MSSPDSAEGAQRGPPPGPQDPRINRVNEAPPLRKTQGDLRPRRAQGSLPPPRLAMPVGHLGRPSTPVWAPGEESPEGPHWQRAARGRGRGGQGAGQGQTDSRGRAIVGGLLLWGCQGRFLWRWASLGVGVDRAHGLRPGNSRLGEMTLLGEAETGQTGSEMQVGSRLCGCPDPETGHRAMLC